MTRQGCARLLIVLASFFSPLFLYASVHPPVRPQLPRLNGPWAVGRQSFDWTDPARSDPAAQTPDHHRELMVFVWYPARPTPGAPPADYFPHAAALDRDSTAQSAARNLFGSAWPGIASRTVLAHAVENAPPVTGRRFPVILFSAGYSAVTFSYTAQIENFVAHGYVVVAVEHPGASGLVRFSNGSLRLFQEPPRPAHPQANSLQQMIASAEQGTQTGAEDLRFVLDQLLRGATPLARLMDLQHAVAVGHSAGGTLSARACQIDARLVACVSEDGEVNPVGAFFDYPDRAPLRQPFLLVEIVNHPSDGDLARMQETRAQWQAFLAHQRAQMTECGRGSELVWIDPRGGGHSMFSDGPLLNATSPAQAAAALDRLRLTENVVLAFLNKTLYKEPAPLLDDSRRAPPGVTVERFGQGTTQAPAR